MHTWAISGDRPDNPAQNSALAEDALKVVMLYQDSLTRAWAVDLWERVSASLKNETFLVQSWRIGDLTHARVLPEAVAAATSATILLVSLRAATELPPELSVWVEGWVPKRGTLPGTLVALLGTGSEPPIDRLPAQLYLEAVAQRAKLDFMPRQRALPGGVPTACSQQKPRPEKLPGKSSFASPLSESETAADQSG